MIKRLLAVLILACVGGQLFAQSKFSGQHELFVAEMEEVFKGATDKKAAKEFLDRNRP